MLRLALVNLVEAGIEVNALIHDGIIVHLDRKKFKSISKISLKVNFSGPTHSIICVSEPSEII